MVSSVWRSPPRQPFSKFSCRIRMDEESETSIRSRVEVAYDVHRQRQCRARNGNTDAQNGAIGTKLECHAHERGAHALPKHPSGGLHAARSTAAMAWNTAQHGTVIRCLKETEPYTGEKHAGRQPGYTDIARRNEHPSQPKNHDDGAKRTEDGNGVALRHVGGDGCHQRPADRPGTEVQPHLRVRRTVNHLEVEGQRDKRTGLSGEKEGRRGHGVANGADTQ